MRDALRLSAAIATLCFASSLSAQETGSPRQTLSVLEVRPEGQILPPTNAAEGGVLTTAIDAQASSEDGEIAFTLSGANNARLGANGQTIFSLRLSSPIGDNADDASFLTDDGLANAINLKFNYSRIFVNLDNTPALETLYLTKCESDAKAKFGQQSAITSFTDFVTEHCGFGTAVHLQKTEQLARFLTPDQVQAVQGHTELRNRPVSILNISASVGRKVFDYVNPGDFSEQKENAIPFAFAIAYGRNANARAPFWGIGYEFKHTFNAADERTFCPPTTSTGTVECRTEIFDAPKRETTHKVFALVRSTRLFGEARPGTLTPAVELRAAYDIENEVLGFTLPIFFLLDDKGNAKGGFRLSVDQKFGDANDTEVGFGIFITKSFDFFSL